MLPNPFGLADWKHWVEAFRPLFQATRDEQQRIQMVSWRKNGTTAHVRFEPSRATLWVQLHVQSTAVGEGGATYDPASYHSSSEIDCRSTRIQDQTLTLDGVENFYLWLIPVFKDPHSGTAVKYDGQGGRSDYAIYVDLGI